MIGSVYLWNFIGAVMIVFGILFALIYGASEANGKRLTHKGEYWGLVVGLGVGTIVVGTFILLLTALAVRNKRVHSH